MPLHSKLEISQLGTAVWRLYKRYNEVYITRSLSLWLPVKMTRAKFRCLSCVKLQIKCDEALPRCEYCCHTNRKCVYPEHSKSAGPPKRPAGRLSVFKNARYGAYGTVTTFAIEKVPQTSVKRQRQVARAHTIAIPERPFPKRQRLQIPTPKYTFPLEHLHSMSRNVSLGGYSGFLPVSPAAFRLLQHFHTGFIPILQDILHKQTWSEEIPSCWQCYFLVRCNTYLLGYLRYSNSSRYFLHVSSKQNLLQTVYDSFAAIQKGPSTPQTVPLAALTFLMLVFQPFQVLPLSSLDQRVDMVRIVRQLRVVMERPGQVHPANFWKRPPPTSLATYLHTKLLALVGLGVVAEIDIALYFEAIERLGDVLGTGRPASVFQWLLLVDEAFFDRATSRDPFASMLLFVFSCFGAVAKLRLQPYTLHCVFREYMHLYWLQKCSFIWSTYHDAFEWHLYLHVMSACEQPLPMLLPSVKGLRL